jgi:hypothetical protein
MIINLLNSSKIKKGLISSLISIRIEKQEN